MANNTNKTTDRRRRMARTVAIIMVLAMLAGSFFYVLMLVASAFGYAGPGLIYAADEALDQSRLDNLESVMEYIEQNFKDEITRDQLIRGAYKGMMEALGDEWSEYYFSEDDIPSLATQLDNQYYGVGITMQMDKDRILITEVNKKGSAYAAGVRAGWYLTEIDGKSVSGMTLSEVALKVRGPEGSTVKLGFDADGTARTFSIKRVRILEATVFYEMKPGKIGYIEISQFSTHTAEEFRDARAALLDQGMQGMILDLRDNGGGMLFQATDVADQLLDEGVISLFYSRGLLQDYELSKNNNTKKVPIVLLINEYTASASECLASALKENGAATLVGINTYGKGVAQTTADVDNGDSLKLSVLEFRGPGNVQIHKVGVAPDQVVYRHGDMTETEAAELLGGLLPVSTERYYAGEYGINVLAAQQRLKIMGYDVDETARLDSKTAAALRSIQKDAGSYSYGNLDNFTINEITRRFAAFLNLDGTDPQMDKAVEVLKDILDSED